MNFYTSTDGLKLAYQDQGQGKPLICIPGLTRDSRDFDYVLPHLTGCRVIRVDLRGRGASAHADPATYKVPVEAGDVLALMDHLGLEKAAILGTSRGGLIAMGLSSVRDRLTGVCLNDVGPDIGKQGLATISGYIGRRPSFRTREEMAAALPALMKGFANVPASRCLEEVERHTTVLPDGLGLTYDPRLGESFTTDYSAEPVDLWPFFDGLAGLPLALIRGANSELLTAETAAEMRRRRPDMIYAEVADRGHIPFLDEPEAIDALQEWIALLP